MHPHFPRDMRQDDMPIVKFHSKHRIGQCFRHGALNFDNIFFGHVSFDLFFRRPYELDDRLGTPAQNLGGTLRLYRNGMFKVGG